MVRKVPLAHRGTLGPKGRKDHQEIEGRKEREEKLLQQLHRLRFQSEEVKSC